MWNLVLLACLYAETAPPEQVAARLRQGQQILETIREDVAGLQDVEFTYERKIEGGAEPVDITSSGRFRLRFTDGAYRITEETVAPLYERRRDRSVLGGRLYLLTKKPGRRPQYSVQEGPAERGFGCAGLCYYFEPILAALQPQRYMAELIGWERRGGIRCARIAIYDRELLGPALGKYVAGLPNAVPPPAVHCWVDLRDGVRVVDAQVTAYVAENGARVERPLVQIDLKRHYEVSWHPGRPPLWVPLEISVRLRQPGGRGEVESRYVVIAESIEVNVGLEDEHLIVAAPPDARVVKPTVPDRRKVQLTPTQKYTQVRVAGPQPSVDPRQLPPEPPAHVLRGPDPEGSWLPAVGVVAGLALVGIGIAIGLRRKK